MAAAGPHLDSSGEEVVSPAKSFVIRSPVSPDVSDIGNEQSVVTDMDSSILGHQAAVWQNVEFVEAERLLVDCAEAVEKFAKDLRALSDDLLIRFDNAPIIVELTDKLTLAAEMVGRTSGADVETCRWLIWFTLFWTNNGWDAQFKILTTRAVCYILGERMDVPMERNEIEAKLLDMKQRAPKVVIALRKSQQWLEEFKHFKAIDVLLSNIENRVMKKATAGYLEERPPKRPRTVAPPVAGNLYVKALTGEVASERDMEQERSVSCLLQGLPPNPNVERASIARIVEYLVDKIQKCPSAAQIELPRNEFESLASGSCFRWKDISPVMRHLSTNNFQYKSFSLWQAHVRAPWYLVRLPSRLLS
mmetsp:Transcript_97174/g.208422  ORF Transcript_97174/g.208422 Transcript_97174/m.208422 type:complete len:362 (-) Transcript_97174:177-1262(-)